MPAAILHLHIPRTAGSTVYRHLLEAVRGERIARIHRRRELEDILDKGITPALVSGHFFWGLHELFKESIYFVPLREPVSRVGSLYDYLRRNPRHRAFNTYSTSTLAEVLRSNSTEYSQLSNGQVRQLRGEGQSKKRKMEKEDFEAAWNNLCRSDVIVGFTDRLDDSFAMLASRTDRKISPCEQTINATERSSIDEDVSAAIRQVNRWDVELYERALQRFG